jgi:hypothetical protein
MKAKFFLHLVQRARVRFLQGDPDEAVRSAYVLMDFVRLDFRNPDAVLVDDAIDEHDRPRSIVEALAAIARAWLAGWEDSRNRLAIDWPWAMAPTTDGPVESRVKLERACVRKAGG